MVAARPSGCCRARIRRPSSTDGTRGHQSAPRGAGGVWLARLIDVIRPQLRQQRFTDFERQRVIQDSSRYLPANAVALEQRPDDIVVTNNLAMLLATHRGDPASLARAGMLAERFAGSDNPAFLDTYGGGLYRLGR